MAKQVTEKHFKDSIIGDFYVDKIQVNTHAHTPTTADFFIQSRKYDIMVECKQVKDIFDVYRLTQETKLTNWEERFARNRSFIFVCWWRGAKNKSPAYLIPIKGWLRFRKNYTNTTIRFGEFHSYLSQYQNNWCVDFDGKL